MDFASSAVLQAMAVCATAYFNSSTLSAREFFISRCYLAMSRITESFLRCGVFGRTLAARIDGRACEERHAHMHALADARASNALAARRKCANARCVHTQCCAGSSGPSRRHRVAPPQPARRASCAHAVVPAARSGRSDPSWRPQVAPFPPEHASARTPRAVGAALAAASREYPRRAWTSHTPPPHPSTHQPPSTLTFQVKPGQCSARSGSGVCIHAPGKTCGVQRGDGLSGVYLYAVAVHGDPQKMYWSTVDLSKRLER